MAKAGLESRWAGARLLPTDDESCKVALRVIPEESKPGFLCNRAGQKSRCSAPITKGFSTYSNITIYYWALRTLDRKV